VDIQSTQNAQFEQVIRTQTEQIRSLRMTVLQIQDSYETARRQANEKEWELVDVRNHYETISTCVVCVPSDRH
jgi:hypothetical protein